MKVHCCFGNPGHQFSFFLNLLNREDWLFSAFGFLVRTVTGWGMGGGEQPAWGTCRITSLCKPFWGSNWSCSACSRLCTSLPGAEAAGDISHSLLALLELRHLCPRHLCFSQCLFCPLLYLSISTKVFHLSFLCVHLLFMTAYELYSLNHAAF